MKLPPRVGRPPEKLSEARRLLAEGRSEDVLALLGSQEPQHRSAEANLLVSECLALRPDPAGALAAAEAALAARGSDTTRLAALKALAEHRRALRQARLAAEAHLAALGIQPDRERQALLGLALRDHGWLDLAAGAFAALDRPTSSWMPEAGLSTTADREEARRAARALLARRRTLDAADLLLLGRRLLSIGKLRGAEAAMRRLPPGMEAEWLAAMIAERRAWPGPRPPAAFELAADAAPGLLMDIAHWLLSGGEVERARAAVSAVDPHGMRPRGWRLRGALLLLTGEAEELGRLADAGGQHLRPMLRAQLQLTAAIVTRRLPLLRVGEVAEAPPPGDLPIVLYWDTPDPPPDVRAAMASWAEHHPGMRLLRFDRAAARAYLVENYGRRGGVAFDACPDAAVEADLLRHAVLAHEGGIWSSAEDACRQSWGGVLAALPPQGLGVTFAAGVPFHLPASPLVALPGNPAMALAVRWTLRALAGRDPGTALNTWQDTGPGVLTRAVAAEPAGCVVLSHGLAARLVGRAQGLEHGRDDAATWTAAAEA